MDSDRSAPVTKGDLQDGLQSLKDELLTTTRQDLQGVKDELLEAFRDGQTELLKAFYNFAQSADARFKDAEVSDSAIRQRLSAAEFRITEIEKRLNMPPAA